MKGSNNHGVEPLGAHLVGHEEVVEVHAGMDRVVHDDKKDTRGRFSHIGMPAVEQDRNVMIPVQENERLLVNNNEEGVDKLPIKNFVSLLFRRGTSNA